MSDEGTGDEYDRTPAVSGPLLRKLANPFRWRAYETLRTFGPMKARELGTLINVSESSILRHIKILEEIHFVETDDPDDTPFRRRVWRAVPGGVRLGDFSGDEPYAAEANQWLKVAILTQAQLLQDWVTVSHEWPRSWRRLVEQWDHVMVALTEDQLGELGRDLNAVVNKWRRISLAQEDQSDPDTHPVYVVTHAVPYPMPFRRGDEA